jgi:hypothetical protein
MAGLVEFGLKLCLGNGTGGFPGLGSGPGGFGNGVLRLDQGKPGIFELVGGVPAGFISNLSCYLQNLKLRPRTKSTVLSSNPAGVTA